MALSATADVFVTIRGCGVRVLRVPIGYGREPLGDFRNVAGLVCGSQLFLQNKSLLSPQGMGGQSQTHPKINKQQNNQNDFPVDKSKLQK